MFATPLDKGRLFLEVVLLAAVVVLLHQQWWQYRVFKLQQLPHTCFLGHGWNLFELVRWVHGGPCAAPGAAAVKRCSWCSSSAAMRPAQDTARTTLGRQ
jgi:hypothetical protein